MNPITEGHWPAALLLLMILEDLETLPENEAIKIALEGTSGVNLTNLRSAVHRVMTSRRTNVETSSDKDNLCIWKKPA